MKGEIKRKLDIIDDLYNHERINTSKIRWNCIWNNKIPEDYYPYTFGWPHFNAYNIRHTLDERIHAYLDGYLFNGKFHDDLIPSIFPGLNHATIPSMFGAKEICLGTETGCEKLINSAEDIDNLPEPKLIKCTPAYYWLDAAKYFLKETDGRIGIHVCDMQGPFDVSAQLWSYDELILCAYEDPKRYHSLLSMATDAFIMLWKAQADILGEAFIGTHIQAHDWIPYGFASTVSVDSLVMYSPSFYNEFVAPYIKRISQAFNGVVVHSCGDFRHVIKMICSTEGVKGINAAQMSIGQLLEAGFDIDKVLICFTKYSELENTMKIIKENNLKVCLTIDDFYINNPDGSVKSELTIDDVNRLKEKERYIQELMKINP